MNAVTRPDARPDLYRPGVGLVFASTWRVGTPERQRAAVDAIAKAWESRDWPDLGLLSYSVYIGTDGDTLLHYSQWTGEEAYQEFFRTLRDERNAEIDAAVPGIVRVGIHRYAPPFRSAVLSEQSAASVPGAVALVDVEFDGPDSGRQRAWVDAVSAAIDDDATGTRPARGGIAAHFHLSTDGTRVLEYAEWESEQAHVEWLAEDAPLSDAWERVRHFPGLVGSRVRRYTPALSLHAGG
ncbi:antibiotic biosynthesis monooxygenase [Streptomyces sp. P9(2023)]|uniref:antibiotic biosynthesis monooxygenase n=1 Tax=Streptomyces sp. P9(2023) TaxID=3064394 RepID=UPI0028F43093|nr:antibiotic biosynthesis monooxygenase [Streptomyces sp. P9(2023)]MDT9687717.1 antibiotic biosynthesis monooxygenase [Streptomyces sp. P9(2023)]